MTGAPTLSFDGSAAPASYPGSSGEQSTPSMNTSNPLPALAEGWQNAIWKLGAVPAERRTGRLSSAANTPEFNRRYEVPLKCTTG